MALQPQGCCPEGGGENTEMWERIVEEHARHRSEFLNPFKFFDNPLVNLPPMLTVQTDTKLFLNFKKHIWRKNIALKANPDS